MLDSLERTFYDGRAEAPGIARTRHLRTCLQCGRDFHTVDQRQRFCSRTCFADSRRARRVRDCECGRSFVARSSRQRYCSSKCAWSLSGRRVGVCGNCGATFERRSPTHRSCSRPCSIEVRASHRLRDCAHCGRPFASIDTRQRFCSVPCAIAGKRRRSGERAYNWKGGRTKSAGYVLVRAPNHPRASRTKPYVFEHLLVMEQILGRYLNPHERVHHKNGRRDDNRPSNLELWRVKDPPGVRAADYHCFGCRCADLSESVVRSNSSSTALTPSLDSPSHSRFEGKDRRWKGGRVRHSAGYVWIWAPTHPRARTTPYVFEHILVMEELLGRPLAPNERVHHRNGRRDDNRPENLELWRMKDPPGVRASDYHCAGCACQNGTAAVSEGRRRYRLGATLNSTCATSPSLIA